MSDSSPEAAASLNSGEPIPDGIRQLRNMRKMWAAETRITKERTAILIEESKQLIQELGKKNFLLP